MIRRLPPLTALRAFEAAARRLSLSRAAEELYVTPAAISHQIKALEEWLGMRMFLRHAGSLELTKAGQIYLNTVSDALDSLWQATDELSIKDTQKTLSVVVPPSIASQWLVPRLSRFRARHPEIELRVTIMTPPIDFSQQMADVGISFGWEVGDGLHREPWMRYEIVAACSPKLLEGPQSIREPCDLSSHCLVQDEALKIHDRIDWRCFLADLGIEDCTTIADCRFNLATYGYQFAILGGGVILAKSALISNDITEGRLVTLFNHSIKSDYHYNFVCPEPLLGSAKVSFFREWLFEEIERDGFLAGPFS